MDDALVGELEVQLSGDVPFISGALAADVLDLAAFASDEEVEGADPGAGWSRDPMGLSGLDAVNADVGFSAGSILFGATTYGRTVGRIALDGGAMTGRISEMAAYGGQLTGRAIVTGGSGVSMRGSLNASGVQLKDFMGDFFDFERITGSGDVTADFASSGGSMYALMNGLNGNGCIDRGATRA